MDNDGLVGGLFFKEPHQNAPDFVKGKLSINVESFREWFKNYLSEHKDDEWVNMDIKISKAGKPYVAIDDWKPESSGFEAGKEMDDVPF